MFVTSEPAVVVAVCGGKIVYDEITSSCLVLDPIEQRWDENRMGSLTKPVSWGKAVQLENIGVFIFGLDSSKRYPVQGASEFLPAGTMQWQEGPPLPDKETYTHPCVVAITPTSFLLIPHKKNLNIREFDADLAGPTSSEGWLEEGGWPTPNFDRTVHCAKIDQKVILSGDSGAGLSGESFSTEILDLVTRRITTGSPMTPQRWSFQALSMYREGVEVALNLAGSFNNYFYYNYRKQPVGLSASLDLVEQWDAESSSWKLVDRLVERRCAFAAVALPRHYVCPASGSFVD